MKRWWALGGAVALVALVAALAVPVRYEGTTTVSAVEVAAEEGVCGQVTSSGDLEIQRTTPLIDLGVLTRVKATLVDPVLGLAATDDCSDVDRVSYGVTLSPASCEAPNQMSATELSEFENARSDGGIAAVVLCEGEAVVLMSETWKDEPFERTSSWDDHRFDLGSDLVVNEPQWCAVTEYWLEVTSSEGSAVSTDARSLEPVVSTWCIDLVAP